MLLAIDIGNTQIVVGIYESGTLIHDFRLQSSTSRTLDEYHALLRSLVANCGVDPDEVSAAIMASVVPPLTECIRSACEKAFAVDVINVGPGIKTGVKIHYEDPREVGADRIVNAVAAYALCKTQAIVVDFGTATTFDCVSANGDYLGGVICPGIQISADALFARAARLPRTALTAPDRTIGRRTEESMRSGIVFGYAAMIEGLVARLKTEMGARPTKILATGGLAPLIAEHAPVIDEVHPQLTLDGLRLIYELNA